MKFKRGLLLFLFLAEAPLVVHGQDIKFNYLGKPITTFEGYSPIYLKGAYAAKDTFGMRQNAVVASFKANSGNPFSFPILGLNSLYDLTRYMDRDSVALYADNTAPNFKAWEIISDAKITATSIVSDYIDNQKVQPGMIIETQSNPKWTTYVVSVSKGKIITSGWVNMKTKHMGTPNTNVIILNPLTKIWAANFNITLPSDSRAIKGVVQENGVVNNKIKSGIVNGVDTVILPYSKFGGASAYVARSANTGFNQQWNAGYLSLGNKYNFVSRNTNVNNSLVSYLDASNSDIGLQFSGNNKKQSIEWLNGEKVTASISPSGQLQKINYKTSTITKSAKLTDDNSRYIFLTHENIIVTLPDTDDLIDGYTLKLSSFGDGAYKIKFESKLAIKGNVDLKNDNWSKELIYYDKQWFLS